MSTPDVVPEKMTDFPTEQCVVQKFDEIDDMSRHFPDMSGKGATKTSHSDLKDADTFVADCLLPA